MQGMDWVPTMGQRPSSMLRLTRQQRLRTCQHTSVQPHATMCRQTSLLVV